MSGRTIAVSMWGSSRRRASRTSRCVVRHSISALAYSPPSTPRTPNGSSANRPSHRRSPKPRGSTDPTNQRRKLSKTAQLGLTLFGGQCVKRLPEPLSSYGFRIQRD